MSKDLLLEAIRARGQKAEPFGRGILTADHYVSTLADMIGPDACNRIAMKGRGSFDDLLRKAAQTLTYSNDGMVIEEKRVNGELGGVELPKNCLMTFRHVLTSSTKDRDGDTLHSDGAEVDPKMLLLWQHVHTLPIGKCLKVTDQNANRLQVVSCIVDMNQLCHDAAVMVDNDMGRFSHGFRALEFTETKARDGHPGGGFDVTKFEVMEESLVSVPANVDAQTEEVLLSLVEGGKLKSPLLKQIGRGIREHRSIQVPGVKIRYRERLGDYSKELTCTSLADLKTAVDVGLIGGKDHENEPGDRGEKGAGAKDGTGAPEETDVKAADKVPAEDADDAKVTCPECEWEGPMPEDGKCPKCGAKLASVEEGALDEEKDIDWIDAKPYPNEHAARLRDPGDFDKLRRQNGKFGQGIDVIFGVTSDGKTEIQAIRFNRDQFTAEEAKKWLDDHKYKPSEFEAASNKDFDPSGEKAGRVLSSANEKRIKEAMGCHDEILKLGEGHTSPPARALVKEAHTHLDAVCKSLGDPTTGLPRDMTAEAVEVDAKTAMAAFLTKATADQRKHMADVLAAIEKAEQNDPRIESYKSLIGDKGDKPGHAFHGNQWGGGSGGGGGSGRSSGSASSGGGGGGGKPSAEAIASAIKASTAARNRSENAEMYSNATKNKSASKAANDAHNHAFNAIQYSSEGMFKQAIEYHKKAIESHSLAASLYSDTFRDHSATQTMTPEQNKNFKAAKAHEGCVESHDRAIIKLKKLADIRDDIY